MDYVIFKIVEKEMEFSKIKDEAKESEKLLKTNTKRTLNETIAIKFKTTVITAKIDQLCCHLKGRFKFCFMQQRNMLKHRKIKKLIGERMESIY